MNNLALINSLKEQIEEMKKKEERLEKEIAEAMVKHHTNFHKIDSFLESKPQVEGTAPKSTWNEWRIKETIGKLRKGQEMSQEFTDTSGCSKRRNERAQMGAWGSLRIKHPRINYHHLRMNRIIFFEYLGFGTKIPKTSIWKGWTSCQLCHSCSRSCPKSKLQKASFGKKSCCFGRFTRKERCSGNFFHKNLVL